MFQERADDQIDAVRRWFQDIWGHQDNGNLVVVHTHYTNTNQMVCLPWEPVLLEMLAWAAGDLHGRRHSPAIEL